MNLWAINILSNREYLAASLITIHLRSVIVIVSKELSKALSVLALNSLISLRIIASLEDKFLALSLLFIIVLIGVSNTWDSDIILL